MKLRLIIASLLAISLVLASCHTPTPEPLPLPEQTNAARTVVYSVGSEQHSQKLTSDAEWDKLLDNLCDFAAGGQSVAFYSLAATHHSSKADGDEKERITFSTANREEMKQWMKDMEKQGRTVNVSYDAGSGTWNGVAYATLGGQPSSEGHCYTGILCSVSSPFGSQRGFGESVAALRVSADSLLYLAFDGGLLTSIEVGYTYDSEADSSELITLCGTIEHQQSDAGEEILVLNLSLFDEATLAGQWQLTSLVKLVVGNATTPATSLELYYWEDDGQSIRYLLAADGTATLEQASTTQTGYWLLSDEGTLCCDLFEGATCWNIHWLSDELLILSAEDYSSAEAPTLYQMELVRN